jgi:hypothetical protein
MQATPAGRYTPPCGGARSPPRKTSRELDIDRDITAVFILGYVEVETTVLVKVIRIDATRKHLLAMNEEAGPPPSRLINPYPAESIHRRSFPPFITFSAITSSPNRI